MMRRSRWFSTTFAVLVALVAGCTSSGPRPPTSATPTQASSSGPVATPSADASATLGSATATPALTPDPVGEEPFTPNNLAFAPDGTLYATDCGNGRVFRVEAGK